MLRIMYVLISSPAPLLQWWLAAYIENLQELPDRLMNSAAWCWWSSTLTAPKLLAQYRLQSPLQASANSVHSIRAGLQRMDDGSNLWNPKYSTAGRSDVTEMMIKAKEGRKKGVNSTVWQFQKNSTVWWCPSLKDPKIAGCSVNSVHAIGWYLQEFPDRLMNPTVWYSDGVQVWWRVTKLLAV